MVLARQRRVQPFDRDAAVRTCELQRETARKIAAEPGLFHIEAEGSLPDPRGLVQDPTRKHANDGRRGRPVLVGRRTEERIKVDPSRGQPGIRPERRPEIELGGALQDLRPPRRVQREIEAGQLGAVGRCLERSLQLDEGRRLAQAPRLGFFRFRLGYSHLVHVLHRLCIALRRLAGAEPIELGDPHDEGTVVRRSRAKARDQAVKLIRGRAIGIAQRRLHPELPAVVYGPGRKPESLRPPFEVIGGGDFVGARERGCARLAVDIPEHERRYAFFDDLDRATRDTHGVEQHIFRYEWSPRAARSDIRPVAVARTVNMQPQGRIDDRELMCLDLAGQQRSHIDLGFEGLRLEKGRIEAPVGVRDPDAVEFEPRRRKDDQMDLAVHFDLPADELAGMGLERRAIVVPIDEERRREERTQHQYEQCRQCQQKRVHRSLCLWLGRRRIVPVLDKRPRAIERQ